MDPIPIAARSSSGIDVYCGPPKFGVHDAFPAVRDKNCRTILFSSAGEYLAYVCGQNLHIVKTANWQNVAVIEGAKTYHLAFSPKGTYLCSWEPFVVNKANPQGAPNLNIYRSENGELVKNFVCKKQSNWEPLWSADEHLFSRIINTDVAFCEASNFNNIANRISAHKVATYSLSPTCDGYFVACHTHGGQGQPSFVRLFKYPNFENQQTVANKSFFQADKVEFYWNAKGTNVLLLAMAEVDKTGGSYYGKQILHFMGTNGQATMVALSKEGPIHSVAWSPKNQEFCVIYGFMPAKATLFNLKCEPIFEFGTGPRNSIYYNPQGNIMLLAGFGNLQGLVEIWNTSSRKLIGKCDATDTTFLQWSPDGIHFLTATTAPRLRIGNGYKVWHYSGVPIHEKPCNQGEELYDICWQKCPKGMFKEPTISSEKVEGIAASQPQATKQAYRPPSARNRPVVQFKLHDDEEAAHKPGSLGGDSAPSKAALKQKKKRENRKARKQDEGDEAVPVANANAPAATSNVQVTLTGDPEKDKKIKNIKKKLDAIAKLKEQQTQGKPLEINQLAKIKGEEDLLNELQQLQL